MSIRSGGNISKEKCPECKTKTDYPSIRCSHCNALYHLFCLGIVSDPPADIEVFYCNNCERKHHKSTIIRTDHLVFLKDVSEETKRNGSKEFLEDFLKREFLSADEIPITRLAGKDVKLKYIEMHGFENPIHVHSSEGLGLKVPPKDFSFKNLVQNIGPLKELIVIDVANQKEQLMYLRELIDYFLKSDRPKIINVLSLEFSNTRLSDLVKPPDLVLKMSWVTNHWTFLASHAMPEVQKYCLISMAGSYTDFHIDFTGSSVWYHVIIGEKKFYLVRPTSENLERFREWMKDEKQPYKYFGGYIDQCYEITIKQGETVFIPSGWIHAVYTPVDSLVFGGNFLNSFNMEMQFKIYDLEERLSTAPKYTFPSFKPVVWLVAFNICGEVLGRHRKPVKKYLLENLKCLYPYLIRWSLNTEDPPPPEVHHSNLLKEVEAIIGAEWEDVSGKEVGVTYCNVYTDYNAPTRRKKARSANAFIMN